MYSVTAGTAAVEVLVWDAAGGVGAVVARPPRRPLSCCAWR